MPKVGNSRVLVTGADGFIGSHLAEQLVAAGARVRALSQYNSFNDWGWLEQVPCLKQIEVITGDVRDPNFCDERNGVKRFIQTSTSEVYGTAQYVPIDEKHPLQPQSPYSATKIGSDCIALSFFYSFGLPLVVARPFNTYGPRQSARAVIPSIIVQIAGGATTISLGNLTATRDFTYVEDTCRGFLAIAEMEGGEGEVFHIGSNHEISVGDLVKLIGEIMGSKVRVVCDEQRLRPEKSEVQRLKCDNSKLRNASSFLPQIPLRQGLERTIHWFSQPENLRRYKGELYNV